MSTAVPRRPEVDALLTLARSANDTIPVGHGVAPSEGGWPNEDTSDASAYVPYAVLWSGPTSEQDGPNNDPDVDTANDYLLTSVGLTADQAGWVADTVGAALLSGELTVPNRSVQSVRVNGGASHSGRDDDTKRPTFFVVDTYVVRTTADPSQGAN